MVKRVHVRTATTTSCAITQNDEKVKSPRPFIVAAGGGYHPPGVHPEDAVLVVTEAWLVTVVSYFEGDTLIRTKYGW